MLTFQPRTHPRTLPEPVLDPDPEIPEPIRMSETPRKFPRTRPRTLPEPDPDPEPEIPEIPELIFLMFWAN